ncbi:MAG: hypothetical protein AAF990_17645 [Bacteroidota bacterium]
MKKLTVFALSLLFAFPLFSQQLFFEAFSGYNLTAYDLEGFESQEGYIPLGFRIAGGFEHIQFGAEYHKDITHATFDQGDFRTEFTNEYYGGLIRANISSLPAYRFGLVLKAGAGLYNTSRQNYSLPSEEVLGEALEYDPQFGFNGGIGFSSPIHTIVHWEMGYMFHYVKYDALQAGAPGYSGFYHSFQAGFSINLVFGNVAKSCRAIIKTDRHGRRRTIR